MKMKRISELEEDFKFALEHNRFTILELLLKHTDCHHLINVADDFGITPLMVAARAGLVETVAWLLQNGAEINARCRIGYTALMFAVHDNRIEVVRLLLEKGADKNLGEYEGVSRFCHKNATELAEYFPHREIIELLKQY